MSTLREIEVIQVSQGILQWNVQVQPETARPKSGRSHVGLAQGLTLCTLQCYSWQKLCIDSCMRDNHGNPGTTFRKEAPTKCRSLSIVDGSLGIAPWNFEWSWRESADHVSSRARVMVIVVETVRLGDMQPLWMHPPTGLGFVSYSHPCKCLPKKSCHDSCNQVHQNFRTQPWPIARNCNRDAPQLFSERCSISTDFFSHVLRKDVCHQSHSLWQSLLPTWVRSNSAMQPSSTGFNLSADKRRRSSFVGKTHHLFESIPWTDWKKSCSKEWKKLPGQGTSGRTGS